VTDTTKSIDEHCNRNYNTVTEKATIFAATPLAIMLSLELVSYILFPDNGFSLISQSENRKMDGPHKKSTKKSKLLSVLPVEACLY
jgi:hypothetical protein